MKDCQDNQVQNALDIPYFEGDFWSNIIEESIKGNARIRLPTTGIRHLLFACLELDQEEEDRRKQEVEAARAIEDGSVDDTFEAEDPTDVGDPGKSSSYSTHRLLDLR